MENRNEITVRTTVHAPIERFGRIGQNLNI